MKSNKLIASFFYLLFSGAITQFVNAQIVYTDITDVTLTCDDNCFKNYSLDLNNDGLGKLMKTITDKSFEVGTHQLPLETKNFNAGIYILKMQTEASVLTKKLIVVK